MLINLFTQRMAVLFRIELIAEFTVVEQSYHRTDRLSLDCLNLSVIFTAKLNLLTEI